MMIPRSAAGTSDRAVQPFVTTTHWSHTDMFQTCVLALWTLLHGAHMLSSFTLWNRMDDVVVGFPWILGSPLKSFTNEKASQLLHHGASRNQVEADRGLWIRLAQSLQRVGHVHNQPAHSTRTEKVMWFSRLQNKIAHQDFFQNTEHES